MLLLNRRACITAALVFGCSGISPKNCS